MPKRSEKKYQGKYYRKRVRKPDGSGYQDVYGKTLDERDRKAEDLLRELTAAYEVEQQRKSTVFFYEYAAGWFSRRSPHLSEKRQETARRYINKIICPVIGQKPMQEITSDDLADVLATVADRSKSYQKDVVQLLKQVFDAALEADVIRKDPSRNLKAGGRKPVKRDALTETQQETLLRAVAGTPVETFVMLALFTGLRREEALGLCWDCVDLDAAAPHLDVRRVCVWENNHRPELREVMKSDAGWRTVPLPQRLVLHLRGEWSRLDEKARREKKIPVIHGENGGLLTYSAFRGRWKVITARSTESGRALGEKIPRHDITVTIDFRVRPHILRKTYITRLILNRVPVKRVQYLAGHADPQITLQIYTDLMEHAPEDLIDDVRSTFDGPDFTPVRTP